MPIPVQTANMSRTMITAPESEGRPDYGSNGHAQFDTHNRRRAQLIRREAARGRPLSLLEAHGYSPSKVDAAAEEFLDMLKHGKTSRPQIEAEQRADAQRLAGWQAVQPDIGTHGAEVLAAIQFRMGARNKALDLFEGFELTTLLSTSRDNQTVPAQPKWTPWRKGAGPSSKEY